MNSEAMSMATQSAIEPTALHIWDFEECICMYSRVEALPADY